MCRLFARTPSGGSRHTFPSRFSSAAGTCEVAPCATYNGVSQATVARHKTKEVNVNEVKIGGTIQNTTAGDEPKRTWQYFAKDGVKSAFFAFTLAVPNDAMTDYVRCVARGALADALSGGDADSLAKGEPGGLIGDDIALVGRLGASKNKKTNQWNLQVVVSDLVGQHSEIAPKLVERAETTTAALPDR